MIRFALCIGSYSMPQFLELNLRAVRDVWGSIPVIVYDGLSKDSKNCKELADRFDAAYISERSNRTHFAGCLQSAVAALAFARANGCSYAIKQNQRTIILSPEIPELLEAVFSNPEIDLALTRSPRAETILDEKSKFHGRFVVSPDIICMRASAIDPQWIADEYAKQVQTDTSRYATLTEHYWARMVEGPFKDRWKELDFLREPNGMYLRKCQHTEAQYAVEAKRLGMNSESFPTQEWSEILGSAYRPMSAFA